MSFLVDSPEGTVIHTLSINRDTGFVTADVVFDYEMHSIYEYLITARNHATPSTPLSATVTLVLRVRDTNDEQPRFDRASYHFSVRENVGQGTAVGRVSATDADATPLFSRVAYRIAREEGDDDDDGSRTARHVGIPFDIDRHTGHITTSGRIDREQTAVFRFTVVATSGEDDEATSTEKTKGSTAVVIYVDDENDNSPILKQPHQIVWIHLGHHQRCHQAAATSTSSGCLITRIQATDDDDGDNGRLTFSIEAEAANLHVSPAPSSSGQQNSAKLSLFAIDPVTGVVTSTRPFPRVTSDARRSDDADDELFYRLLVSVKDNGVPPRAAVTDLIVRINATSSTALSAVPSGGRRHDVSDVDATDDDDKLGSINPVGPASASVLSDERLVILLAMICGVIIIGLVTSTICCFFVLRRRSRRDVKAVDAKYDCDGAQKAGGLDSASGVSSSLMAASGRSLSGLSGSMREHVVNEGAIDNPAEGDNRTAEMIRADLKYRKMLEVSG